METRISLPNEIHRAEHSTIVHLHLDWGIVRADIVKRTGLSRQETRVSLDQHAFFINLKGEARAGENFVEGRRVAFTPRRPGSIVFVPAQSEWSGWDEGDAVGSYLSVLIDAAFAEDLLGAEYVAALQPAIGFRDDMIEAALQRIAEELKNPDPTSVLMVESQAIQMLVRIVRLNVSGGEPAKGGLSPFDLKHVLDILEARLSRPPRVKELADEIGVSRRHFSRAFRQSTGKTPCRFVADLRLQRAVDLLRTTDRTATAVALDCGFASPSHLTVAFRRAYGASPSEFRRRWMS